MIEQEKEDDYLGRPVVVAPAVFEDSPRERPRCNHRMFRSSLFSLLSVLDESSRSLGGVRLDRAEGEELARRERQAESARRRSGSRYSSLEAACSFYVSSSGSLRL